MRALLVSLLLVAAASPSPSAAAEDASTRRAKIYFEEGIKNYHVGDYRQALDAFKAGYFAKRDAIFLFNMAQCYRMLGDPESAAREYRAYMNEKPDAGNRADVEKLIADQEALLRRKADATPPTGVLAPPPPETKPASLAPSVTAPAPAPREHKRKWWIAGVAAGAAVVVAGVALGLAYGLPADAPTRPGAMTVNFP